MPRVTYEISDVERAILSAKIAAGAAKYQWCPECSCGVFLVYKTTHRGITTESRRCRACRHVTTHQYPQL